MHKDIINETLGISPAEKNGGSSCEELQSRMDFLFSHIRKVKSSSRRQKQNIFRQACQSHKGVRRRKHSYGKAWVLRGLHESCQYWKLIRM